MILLFLEQKQNRVITLTQILQGLLFSCCALRQWIPGPFYPRGDQHEKRNTWRHLHVKSYRVGILHHIFDPQWDSKEEKNSEFVSFATYSQTENKKEGRHENPVTRVSRTVFGALSSAMCLIMSSGH